MSKICNGCGTEKSPASVPYVVHESAMARAERQTKSLVWVIVLLIVLLVGSNCAWLWYNSQFETVIETTETIFEDVAQESAEGSKYQSEHNTTNLQKLCVEVADFCRAIYSSTQNEEERNIYYVMLDKLNKR